MRLVPCEPVAFDEYLVQVLTILLISTGASEPRKGPKHGKLVQVLTILVISTGASEPRPADRIVRVVSNVRY